MRVVSVVQLFPYHLSDYVCRVLRVTPFRYYCDLLFTVMREEKSYDQIPNFTVGSRNTTCYPHCSAFGPNPFPSSIFKCLSGNPCVILGNYRSVCPLYCCISIRRRGRSSPCQFNHCIWHLKRMFKLCPVVLLFPGLARGMHVQLCHFMSRRQRTSCALWASGGTST